MKRCLTKHTVVQKSSDMDKEDISVSGRRHGAHLRLTLALALRCTGVLLQCTHTLDRFWSLLARLFFSYVDSPAEMHPFIWDAYKHTMLQACAKSYFCP